MKKILVSTMLFSVVAIFSVSTYANVEISTDDKPYAEHLRKYIESGWQDKVERLGASYQVRELLLKHRYKYDFDGGIVVLKVEHVDTKPESRKILYFYQSPRENSEEKSFVAIVEKVENALQYKIVSIDEADFDVLRYRQSELSEKYRKFSSYYKEVSIGEIDNKYSGRKLPGNVISLVNYFDYGDIYALYKFYYEADIAAYIVATPQCYGTSRSGIEIYFYRENENKSIEYKNHQKEYIETTILSESCDDEGWQTRTNGGLVDLNNDGYLDVIRSDIVHSYNMDTGEEKLIKESYYKGMYVGRGKLEFIKINKQEFEEIMNTQNVLVFQLND